MSPSCFVDNPLFYFLDMILMEANYGSLDQTIGDAWFPLNEQELPCNQTVTKSFFFNGVGFFVLGVGVLVFSCVCIRIFHRLFPMPTCRHIFVFQKSEVELEFRVEEEYVDSFY